MIVAAKVQCDKRENELIRSAKNGYSPLRFGMYSQVRSTFRQLSYAPYEHLMRDLVVAKILNDSLTIFKWFF